LGSRKGIRPVKTEWWGAGMVIYLERGADLHTAQPMPLSLTVSCFSKIQIGFTFLVPADLGCPALKGPLNGYGNFQMTPMMTIDCYRKLMAKNRNTAPRSQIRLRISTAGKSEHAEVSP